MYEIFSTLSYIIPGYLQQSRRRKLLAPVDGKCRHEKHQLLTLGVEFESNTGGFFLFPD